MSIVAGDWHEGQELPVQVYRVTRADLVRYAGASGDFNPIHYSDRIARSVGLPGVIAHGMYTMALAGRALATWAGRPDAVLEFGVRFTKPVVVPDDDEGAEVIVGGAVRAVMGAVPGGGITGAVPGGGITGAVPGGGITGAVPGGGSTAEQVQVDLTVTSGGEKVLAQARATLRIPPSQ